MPMQKRRRIVLTGGPGGGKTTAAELLRRELGSKLVIVPEAATGPSAPEGYRLLRNNLRSSSDSERSCPSS